MGRPGGHPEGFGAAAGEPSRTRSCGNPRRTRTGDSRSWGRGRSHGSRWSLAAQVGVTTHELLRLLGMTFRTDATIDRVETGRLLEWRAQDRQKQLHGSRLVEPTGPASSRFTEVVEVACSVCCDRWSGRWPGCSSGKPQPICDGSNTCWRRRPLSGSAPEETAT